MGKVLRRALVGTLPAVAALMALGSGQAFASTAHPAVPHAAAHHSGSSATTRHNSPQWIVPAVTGTCPSTCPSTVPATVVPATVGILGGLDLNLFLGLGVGLGYPSVVTMPSTCDCGSGAPSTGTCGTGTGSSSGQ